MKVLLTGSKGQLAQEIIKSKPDNVDLVCLTRDNFDLTNIDFIISKLGEIKPNFIFNCGAYTNVDKAEKERDLALKTNCSSVKEMCKYLKINGGNLIQISTDYVFSGKKSIAYKTNDNVSPINHYGYTKVKAEEHINEILGSTNQAIIIRTSWLMGTKSKNFLLTMLKLHQNEDKIDVVSDQISCPTSTTTLAEACWKSFFLKDQINSTNKETTPILHWCDDGLASWYDVAFTIGQTAKDLGIIDKPAYIEPIKSNKFSSKAKRPNFSLLDCESSRQILNLKGIHWQSSIRESLKNIVKG